MNQTETKAFNWLITQGYAATDIIEQKRKSPDFIMRDGTGYEVKLVYGKTIWFHIEQFELLKRQKNTTILVFNKIDDIPILILPATDLEKGKMFDNLKIVVAASKRSIELPSELLEKIRDYNKAHSNRPINVSGVCRIALEKEFNNAIDGS
jgi:hypothetical protein